MVAKFSDREAVYLGVWPLPGSNEIEVAHRLHAEMERLRPTLPSDIDMRLAYDATVFMENALTEITKTLAETILIVGIVVFLFMGSARTALSDRYYTDAGYRRVGSKNLERALFERTLEAPAARIG